MESATLSFTGRDPQGVKGANSSHAFPVWGEVMAAKAALGLTVVKITVVVYRREERGIKATDTKEGGDISVQKLEREQHSPLSSADAAVGATETSLVTTTLWSERHMSTSTPGGGAHLGQTLMLIIRSQCDHESKVTIKALSADVHQYSISSSFARWQHSLKICSSFCKFR